MKTSVHVLKSNIPILAAIALLSMLASSCQSPAVTSGNSSNLKLSFRVMGTSSSSSASKMGTTSLSQTKKVIPPVSGIPARLLLPTASSLIVVLYPENSSLPMPTPQTVAIPSSGDEQVVSASFSDVPWGNYDLLAVAYDADKNPQFENAVENFAVSSSTSSATINLIPVNFTVVVPENYTYTFPLDTLTPGQAYSFAVATSSVLSDGTSYFHSIPSGSYEITSVDTSTFTAKLFVQNLDGSLIYSGDVSGSSISPASSGSSIYVTPSSDSTLTFVTFYYTGTTGASSDIVINNDYYYAP